MNSTQQIIDNAVAARGARIVSFFYDGKPRNAVVGYKGENMGHRVWGTHVSRSIVSHRGKLYLTAKTNNEKDSPDGHAYKAFALDKIENLKCR